MSEIAAIAAICVVDIGTGGAHHGTPDGSGAPASAATSMARARRRRKEAHRNPK